MIALATFQYSLAGEKSKNTLNPDTVVSAISNKAIPMLKLFPDDTVARFISKYGTDSLKRLLNNKIVLAQSFINQNKDKLYGDNVINEYISFSKHFNLKVDFNSYDTTKYMESLYQLYGRKGNFVAPMSIAIDSMLKAGLKLSDSFYNKFNDDYAQSAMISFCNNIKYQSQYFEDLYAFSKKQKINDRIKLYWLFSELMHNCAENTDTIKSYKLKLFDDLFPRNNPKAFYLDAFPAIGIRDSSTANSFYQTPKEKELDIFYDKYSPLRMLAYALYANDVNMTNYSDNLIYLLDAQQENGSWSLAKKFNHFNSDPTSTIYGFWSLCEFKSKLLNNK
jgi:hypothetical protein